MTAHETVPRLNPDLRPPLIHGTAALAHRAYAGAGLPQLIEFIARPSASSEEQGGLLLDAALAHELSFRPDHWPALQQAALLRSCLFRVAGRPAPSPPLRLLALVAPGNLMTNTPLDFITAHLDVRLDLLFVAPDRPLPPEVPDHDLAFFAVGESGSAALRRLAPLFQAWPRPALNDPAAVQRLSRDEVARGLGRLPGIVCPEAVRAAPEGVRQAFAGIFGHGPVLIRPAGSHAGHDLEKIADETEIGAYLGRVAADEFFLTRFVEYRGPDGLYRKFRIALIGGVPMLCHMATSAHWMVHYLNAGMAEHPERRADEARAMAEFDRGFAVRHAGALAAIADWTGLDYVQIDCAETPDGRLLVFEADVAAIIHLMDPPDLFPYKPPQMRRVFGEFEAMLRRRAAARSMAA